MINYVKQSKVADKLPTTLEPDTIYYVKTVLGFDLYITDKLGLVALPLNSQLFVDVSNISSSAAESAAAGADQSAATASQGATSASKSATASAQNATSANQSVLSAAQSANSASQNVTATGQSKIAASQSAASASQFATAASQSAASAAQSATTSAQSVVTASQSAVSAAQSATNASQSAAAAAQSTAGATQSAANATQSKTAAAQSAASASQSTIAAGQSAAGAGQTATTAAQSATVTGQAAAAAAQSATNTSQSATASGQSATATAQSASNTAVSATAASQSATAAAQSATVASQSSTAAAQSATNAAQSATSATQGKTASTLSATAASQSATTASQSATTTGQSATNASQSNATTGQAAAAAALSATSTSQSTTAASQSNTAAGQSAASASQLAATAGQSATAASQSNTTTGQSAAAAALNATNASQSATATGQSNTAAGQSATAASQFATTAGQSATAAGQSNTASGLSATAAALNATNASQSAAAASQSNTAASQAATATSQSVTAASSSVVAASQFAITATQNVAISNQNVNNALALYQSEALVTVNKTIHNGAIVKNIIYDTSKDSDGGAWRKRCQDKSWFTETLGGTTWLGQAANELTARGDNLFTYPEELDNNVWGKSNTVITPNQSVSPDGSTTADLVTATAGGQNFLQTITINPTKPSSFSFSVKNSVGSGWFVAICYTPTTVNGGRVWFNAATGAIGQSVISGTATGLSSTMVPTGNGTFRCTVNVAANGGDSALRFEVNQATTDGGYAATVGDAKFFWGFKLNTIGLLPSTYSASPELVSNGGFDNGTVGWTPANGATLSAGLNLLTLTNDATNANTGGASQVITVVIGRIYVLMLDYVKGTTPSVGVCVGLSVINGANGVSYATASGKISVVFVATAASVFISIFNNNSLANGTSQFDNISVKEVTILATPYVPYSALANNYYQSTTDNKFYSLRFTYGQTEVFKGNVREFPQQVAVIMEIDRVVIYDLTQPGTPMWRVIRGYAVGLFIGDGYGFRANAVAAMNGTIYIGLSQTDSNEVGTYGGVVVHNFIRATVTKVGGSNFYSGYGDRPMDLLLSTQYQSFKNVPKINFISGWVNDIAVTVLDNAPTDAATGLPVPTVAVATTAGVSVIKDDGTVANWLTNRGHITAITIDGTRLFATGGITIAYASWGRNTIPTGTDNTVDYSFDQFSIPQRPGTNGATGQMTSAANTSKTQKALGSNNLLSNSLILIKENVSTYSKTMIASISNSSNTGWQVGDARLAILADTVAETIVGEQLIVGDSSNFNGGVGAWKIPVGGQWRQGTVTAVNNRLTATNPLAPTTASVTWSAGMVTLVTNAPHNFQTGEYTNVAGFTPAGYNGYFLVTAVDAKTLTYSLATNPGVATVLGAPTSGAIAELQFVTTPGKRYIIQFTAYAANSYLSISNSVNAGSNGNIVGQTSVAPGSIKIEFIANTAVTFLNVYKSQAPGEVVQWSGFTCGIVQVDRSAKNTGLTVNGTLTKTPVAPGAQLVTYSGWSAANNLQQPYNSNLDFGTGEFSVCAWANYLNGNVNANLLAYPEEFSNEPWSAVAVSIVSNTVNAPNGTLTADKLVADLTSTSHYVKQITRVDGGPGVNTFSFHVKSGEYQGVIYQCTNGLGLGFNTTTGQRTGGDNVVWSSVDVGNGWWKISITHAAIGFNSQHLLHVSNLASPGYPASFVGDGASGIYIWGAQLSPGAGCVYVPGRTTTYLPLAAIAERSASAGPSLVFGSDVAGKLVATAFDGTTTRTATSPLAYNTGLSTLVSAIYRTDGSLAINVNDLEVIRTLGTPLLTMNSASPRHNLLTKTEQLSDGSVWGKANTTAVDNATADETGALRLANVSNTAGANSYIVSTVVLLNSATYTRHAVAKLVSGAPLIIFETYTGAAFLVVSFNLSTGVCNGPGTIVPLGGGLFKCIQTFTTAATGNTNATVIYIGAYGNTSVATTIAVGRLQLEVGASPSMYQRVNTETDYDTTVSVKASLTIGNSRTLDAPFVGSIALLRISATAPTADQIAFIYRTELALFAAAAQCTIDGTTAAVTTIAYDDNTEALHVGTAWGRSVFKNLLRIESGASVVGGITSISANQGSLLSGGSTNSRYYQPALLLRDELRRKEEAKKALGKVAVFFEYDTLTAQTAFILPKGYTIKAVYVTGTLKRIGNTKDYTVINDGFAESAVFAVSPGAAVYVSVMAVKN